MSAAEHKALIRRIVDSFNTGDLDTAEPCFSEDFVDHGRPFLPPGRQALRAFYEGMSQAIADFRITVEDMVAEGDRVVVRAVATGRHVGELMGIPATGRQFTLHVIDINRIVDGRIVERWAVQDDLGLLQQLGVIPAPGATGEPAAR